MFHSTCCYSWLRLLIFGILLNRCLCDLEPNLTLHDSPLPYNPDVSLFQADIVQNKDFNDDFLLAVLGAIAHQDQQTLYKVFGFHTVMNGRTVWPITLYWKNGTQHTFMRDELTEQIRKENHSKTQWVALLEATLNEWYKVYDIYTAFGAKGTGSDVIDMFTAFYGPDVGLHRGNMNDTELEIFKTTIDSAPMVYVTKSDLGSDLPSDHHYTVIGYDDAGMIVRNTQGNLPKEYPDNLGDLPNSIRSVGNKYARGSFHMEWEIAAAYCKEFISVKMADKKKIVSSIIDDAIASDNARWTASTSYNTSLSPFTSFTTPTSWKNGPPPTSEVQAVTKREQRPAAPESLNTEESHKIRSAEDAATTYDAATKPFSSFTTPTSWKNGPPPTSKISVSSNGQTNSSMWTGTFARVTSSTSTDVATQAESIVT